MINQRIINAIKECVWEQRGQGANRIFFLNVCCCEFIAGEKQRCSLSFFNIITVSRSSSFIRVMFHRSYQRKKNHYSPAYKTVNQDFFREQNSLSDGNQLILSVPFCTYVTENQSLLVEINYTPVIIELKRHLFCVLFILGTEEKLQPSETTVFYYVYVRPFKFRISNTNTKCGMKIKFWIRNIKISVKIDRMNFSKYLKKFIQYNIISFSSNSSITCVLRNLCRQTSIISNYT